MKQFFQALGLLSIVVVWFLILFHPIILSFYYGNFLWLFLYFLVSAEVVVGYLYTSFILKILD